MSIHFLTGPDAAAITARISELVPGNTHIERFDLTEPDDQAHLLQVVGVQNLFGVRQALLISPADKLTEELATQLATNLNPSTDLIFYGEKKPAKRAVGCFEGANSETFAIPTTYNAPSRVKEVAKRLGVSPTPGGLQLLSHLAPYHWGLVQQVLQNCADTGVRYPKEDDLRPLLGAATQPAYPWSLFEAMIAGDRLQVLRDSEVLEPFSTLGYLTSRLALVGKIVEFGDLSLTEMGQRLSLSEAAVRQLLPLASRLGTKGVARTWQVLSEGETDMKLGTTPQQILLLLAMKLTGLWQQGASTS